MSPQACRFGRPGAVGHRRISLLHAQGYSWAQISELVGNASAKVLSDTYTHVLMDEREIDYASVIAERPPALAEPFSTDERGQGRRRQTRLLHRRRLGRSVE